MLWKKNNKKTKPRALGSPKPLGNRSTAGGAWPWAACHPTATHILPMTRPLLPRAREGTEAVVSVGNTTSDVVWAACGAGEAQSTRSVPVSFLPASGHLPKAVPLSQSAHTLKRLLKRRRAGGWQLRWRWRRSCSPDSSSSPGIKCRSAAWYLGERLSGMSVGCSGR